MCEQPLFKVWRYRLHKLGTPKVLQTNGWSVVQTVEIMPILNQHLDEIILPNSTFTLSYRFNSHQIL